MMKTSSFFLAFFLCIFWLNAQTYFAPIGTKWYNNREQFSPTPPNPGFAVFTVVDTAEIQGKKCIVVTGGDDCLTINGQSYIYQENKQVFVTRDSVHPFMPLYDFGAGVGATFTSYTWDLNHSGTFQVIAKQTVTVGGQVFKIQHIIPVGGEVSLGDQVVEFVGGTTLFPQFAACDPVLGSLLCYDNGFFSYPVSPCGIVDAEEAFTQSRVQLTPNPVDDLLNLQVTDWPSSELPVQVYNLRGQLVASIIYEKTAGNLSLDVRSWPSGLYFIKIGTLLCQKVIVQH